VLDGLWRRLGIDTAMSGLLAKRRITSPFERVLFGLVANRALAPSSKLAAADWITNDVHVDGLPETCDVSKPQRDLYARLDLPLPKKIIEISAAQS
jgi:hypothetical protein